MTEEANPSVIPETPELEDEEISETDGVTVVPESLDIDDDTGHEHIEAIEAVEQQNESTLPSQIREEETTVTPAKLFRFPLGTIKKIVKLDEDVHMVNAEAIFLISKVTEQFIESLAVESFSYTTKNKKKTLMKNDVNTAIETVEALAFLDGAMEE